MYLNLSLPICSTLIKTIKVTFWVKILYTEKLEFAVPEWPFIACWASPILLKESSWLKTVKKSQIGHEIMIFAILLIILYCKLKMFFSSKSNYQSNDRRVGKWITEVQTIVHLLVKLRTLKLLLKSRPWHFFFSE